MSFLNDDSTTLLHVDVFFCYSLICCVSARNILACVTSHVSFLKLQPIIQFMFRHHIWLRRQALPSRGDKKLCEYPFGYPNFIRMYLRLPLTVIGKSNKQHEFQNWCVHTPFWWVCQHPWQLSCTTASRLIACLTNSDQQVHFTAFLAACLMNQNELQRNLEGCVCTVPSWRHISSTEDFSVSPPGDPGVAC